MMPGPGRHVELKLLGKTPPGLQAVGISDREFQELETDPGLPGADDRDYGFCGCMMSFRSKYRDRIPPIPDVIGHDDWLAVTLSPAEQDSGDLHDP